MGCQYKTMDMNNAPLNGTGTGNARANSEHCRIHCGQILSSISSGILHLAIRSPSFATRAMLTATHRLLRLLSLLQTRSHWSGPELATTLEVHPRTLRRDIDKLRELGYRSTPAAASPAMRPGKALPPLLLDDEEALAVAITLRTAAAGSVGGIEETALRALIKLEQVMPARLRRRTRAARRRRAAGAAWPHGGRGAAGHAGDGLPRSIAGGV